MTVVFTPADEYLDIDGVVLATHAYWVESLAPLFTLQNRGVTEVMPYVSGAVSYPRRRTFTTVTLGLHVFGDVDADGVPTANPRAGLYAHLEHLETNLLAEVPGTRTATWHRPGGGTRTAQVNVESFIVRGSPDDNPYHVYATLELSVPDGRFS